MAGNPGDYSLEDVERILEEFENELDSRIINNEKVRALLVKHAGGFSDSAD